MLGALSLCDTVCQSVQTPSPAPPFCVFASEILHILQKQQSPAVPVSPEKGQQVSAPHLFETKLQGN